MAMDHIGRLVKRAASTEAAPFLQKRTGRRPIRVQKVLDNEAKAYLPEKADPRRLKAGAEVHSPMDIEYEGGQGIGEGTMYKGAEKKDKPKKPLKERALRGFVKARPYATAGVTAGVPAGIFAKMLLPEKPTGRVGKVLTRMGPGGAALIGAGLGVTNLALKRWARKKRKKTKLVKQILKTGSATYEVPASQYTIRKIAAMATDLRRKGIGGVARPPFPTEDSKSFAEKQFNKSQKPGAFATGMTQPKHLVKPGPSIGMLSSAPVV
jgi:hypothetical protein